MNVDFVCVVLAAGASARFGSRKLLATLPDGDRLIDRSLYAVARYPHCIVASPAIAAQIADESAGIVVNDRADLGMAHSLQLAAAQIDLGCALLVLPADLPLVEPQHVALVARAGADYDVTYPRRADGTPGHPVFFAQSARPHIAGLQARQPISSVRDRPELTRRVLAIDEPWPYRDVDRESDLASIAADFRSGRSEPQ